ncbi:winged helix-turn-helix transcriptional regulator [Kutzneria sp. CA-103260]|uniref:winged helix-turn-helix transcriptional regulator n=1 Tax=Kutzneria sp. CA-103260 TaxID=2802641 RepID=UPI001BA9E10F|nr:helix-turn-helix domain-containing protein [Kutzneria sp. CA-103260]QUQ67446.1 transcriptional regulator [Kutzneria sp. CA-103260]
MTPHCPGQPVFDTVTSRWGAPILLALGERPHRFAQLRDRLTGVSEKMLAQTLRTLAVRGFVHRAATTTVPPQVTYSLTPLGQDLSPKLRDLVVWLGANAVDPPADAASPRT